MECYLAVTKPITYNRLTQANGIRIRNISIRNVCILYLLNFIVYYLVSSDLIMFFCITGFILTVICSISVRCALVNPGPEELNRNREQVDRSKEVFLHHISAVLLIRIGRYMIGTFTYNSVVGDPYSADPN